MTATELSGRTVTVFGAGGFIGTNVCAALSLAGAKVHCFGRRSRLAIPYEPQSWFEAEFTDIDAVKAAVAGADFVIHLLGGSSPAVYNNAPAQEVMANIIPSLGLLDACRNAGVGRVIFLSSGGTVYGPDVMTPTNETAPTNPISAYGIGKLAVEKYLGLFHHLFGLDYRVLRVANPFGPYQLPNRGQGFIAQAIQCALDHEPIEIWGDGSIVRDYIYVADVANAVVRSLLHRGDERVFNIGSNVGLSLLDVISSIEHVVDKPFDITFLGSRPVDVQCSILDTSRAETSLGWKPQTDFLYALENTKNWLISYRGS